MQTFLPYPSFTDSAAVLDRQRLGKQRVEAWQILTALTVGSGWVNHPAVRMWRGYSPALALYGQTICREWIRRGYRDSLLERFDAASGTDVAMPPWIGDPDFHVSHQSNLVRKLPAHYRAYWPDVPGDLPYIWPQETLPKL